jgi:hypothetical protein
MIYSQELKSQKCVEDNNWVHEIKGIVKVVGVGGSKVNAPIPNPMMYNVRRSQRTSCNPLCKWKSHISKDPIESQSTTRMLIK